MELGLSIPHTGRAASPALVRDLSQAAEALGYGSLWTVDHVVLPAHVDSSYTLGREPAAIGAGAMSEQLAPNYESLSTLLWVAGLTSRIRLGTAIAVLPLRNPLLNARMLATLDVYSGGRLLYGVGVGWLKEEADAMQVPWDRRGARSEEHIELLRRVWLCPDEVVSFAGEHYRFDAIDPEPRPVQQPPPILVGGHSDVALRRAGRLGDGWIASSMSPDRLSTHWDAVRREAEACGRDPEGLLLVDSTRVRLTDSPTSPLAEPLAALRARLDGYRRLGVDHLKLSLVADDGAVLLAAAEVLGRELIAG